MYRQLVFKKVTEPRTSRASYWMIYGLSLERHIGCRGRDLWFCACVLSEVQSNASEWQWRLAFTVCLTVCSLMCYS